MKYLNLAELNNEKEKGRLQSPLTEKIMNQILIAFCDEQEYTDIIEYTKMDVRNLTKVGYKVEVIKTTGILGNNKPEKLRVWLILK